MGTDRRDPTRERQRLASEAARLLAAGGAVDAADARERIARRLGIHDRRELPSLRAIEQELFAHQQLFQADRQPAALRRRRAAAVPAMRALAAFAPRLVGAVLTGTADDHSGIELLLHTDEPEAVLRQLVELAIPAQATTRRVRRERGATDEVPGFDFIADGLPFRLTVLPTAALRRAPRDADDRPLARADLAAVEALLAETP